MSKNKALLACHCGECNIILLDRRVRYKIECLCFDCRQRAMISQSMGNPRAFPNPLEKRARGVEIIYFSNALQVDDKSRTLLQFRKLREDGFNVTAYASCCGTIMLSSHPAYDGQSVSVLPNNCRVKGEIDTSVSMFLFAGDFSQEKLHALEIPKGVPVVFSPYEEMEEAPMQRFVQAATAKYESEGSAEPFVTYEQLYQDVALIISDDYFDESRI